MNSEIIQLYQEFKETNNPLTEFILVESLVENGFDCSTEDKIEALYDEIEHQMG